MSHQGPGRDVHRLKTTYLSPLRGWHGDCIVHTIINPAYLHTMSHSTVTVTFTIESACVMALGGVSPEGRRALVLALQALPEGLSPFNPSVSRAHVSLVEAAQAEVFPAEVVHSAHVRSLKKGEYVKSSADAKKVYQRGDYVRGSDRFELIDCDDVNRVVLVKGDAVVFYGFTY